MPTTKSKAVKPPTAGNSDTVAPALFPFAQYASVLAVHLILVAFAALCLPQTTRLFAPLPARKTDRPQSDFMEALTADPSLTLGWTSAGLTLLQVWWASWVRKWSPFERTEVDRFTRLKDAATFTVGAALVTYVVVVVFGAPMASRVSQTALLAFVIAILTAFTPAFVLGLPPLASDAASTINRSTWMRLFAELSPRDAIECAMVYPAVGTFIGSWLGAIPIALDWDRPWQAWPLTPLFGSLGGYIIGALWAFIFSTAKWLAAEQDRSQPSKTKSS